MRTITMESYRKEIAEQEAGMKERSFFTGKLDRMCAEIEEHLEASQIVIKSDYDADGICSAYILYQTLQTMYPTKAISVKINDRRGSYGEIGGDVPNEAQVFILDMGSNELDAIEEQFSNAFVIDHHLTENVGRMQNNARYVNPKTFENGGDYCTTGLCYRLFEELQDRSAEESPLRNEKLQNTLVAIAAIGTIADVVNLMDADSFNRQIVKKGLQAINTATKETFDETIGYFLQNACKDINGRNGRDITAKDIAMSIAPFINGAGRMSELIEQNGSQTVFDAMIHPTPLIMAKLNEYNALRKAIGKQVKTGTELTDYIDKNLDGFKVNVFLDKEIPHSLCGIVAGAMAENLDAPAICLTYNEKTNTYSGSGRNAKCTESLNAWLTDALQGMDVAFGGHADALGISRLNAEDYDTFLQRIEAANFSNPIKRKEDNILVLDMKPSEIMERQEEVMAFLREVEPSYTKLYCIAQNEGRSKGAVFGSCPVWKKVIFKEKDTKFTVTDWAFNEKKYALTHSLLELGINTYGAKEELSFTEAYRRQFNTYLLKHKDLYKVESPTPVKRTKKEKNPSEPEKKFRGTLFNFGKR